MANFGGPVWHASVAFHGTPTRYTPQAREQRVRKALRGVGDPMLGEWDEGSSRASHLRRRVTPLEWGDRGPLRDIRGTDEARQRLAAAGCRPEWVPEEWGA